jgi:hypothetical protein
VLATHDEAFAERLTGEVWDLRDGELEIRRRPAGGS